MSSLTFPLPDQRNILTLTEAVGNMPLLSSREEEWFETILSFFQQTALDRTIDHLTLTKSLHNLVSHPHTFHLSSSHFFNHEISKILESFSGDKRTRYAQLRQLLCYLLTVPGKKEFSDMGALVRSESSFEKGFKEMYQDLYQLLQSEPSLQIENASEASGNFKWIHGDDDSNNVLCFFTKSPEGRYLIHFHHFGESEIKGYRVQFPDVRYFPFQRSVVQMHQIFNTNDLKYGGDHFVDHSPKIGKNASQESDHFLIDITPSTSMIFELTIDESKEACPVTLPPVPFPCLAFKTFVQERFLNSDLITPRVQAQIDSCITAHLKGEDSFTIHYGDNFSITDLTSKELAHFYFILFSYLQYLTYTDFNPSKAAEPKSNPQITIFRALAFDVRDQCFRIAFSDKQEGRKVIESLKAIHDPFLDKTIAKLETITSDQFPVIFHRLVDRNDPDSPLTKIAQTRMICARPAEEQGESPRKVRIWKIAQENTRNVIGGLGSVLSASFKAHESMGFEKVRSVHPLYTHDKLRMLTKENGELVLSENGGCVLSEDEYSFKGVVQHQFARAGETKPELFEENPIVTSSVYKKKSTGEFFIQPDSKYREIFDVYSARNIYGGFFYSNRMDRYLYLASAGAVAAATFCGKTGRKTVDIFQADAWHSGSVAFMLVREILDSLRIEQKMSPLELTFLTHMLVEELEEQGIAKYHHLKAVGLSPQAKTNINLAASGLILSDKNIFVSHGVANDAIHPKTTFNKGLREATLSGGREKVIGITNGINTSDFDVTSLKLFGTLAVTKGNFLAAQKQIKIILFEREIIADPQKPLVLFVGRYSREKGIDMLPEIVEEVYKQNAQMVIMGLYNSDTENDRPEVIAKLKTMATSKKYKDMLRVYDKRSDQMDPFSIPGDSSCTPKIGLLIRRATSIVVVPSFAEACGLVPLEMQCMGAITVAPYHQGLRDMCLPCDAESLTGGEKYQLSDRGNAFCYSDCYDKDQAQKATQNALTALRSMSEEDLNDFMSRTNAYAMENYDWAVKKDGKVVGGAAYLYSQVYHGLVHKNGIRPEIRTFEQTVLFAYGR